MSHKKAKAAIDCRGYRSVMDAMVDLILANGEDRDDVIDDFNAIQARQQKEWNEFVAENYDFTDQSK